MSRSGENIAIVIPALNEEEAIADCLEALLGGSCLPAETIVVDGGSDDDTVRIARDLGATVLDNPNKTAAAGRNVGIKMAQTEYIAFIDADCIPSALWLESLLNRLEKSDVDGVAGKIIPRSPRNEYEAYWNHIAWEVLMCFGDEPGRIAEKDLRHSVVTASCAYRRDALEKLGGFDEWFGNNAEDVDLTWRAIDAGMSLMYEPSAIVMASGVLSMTGIRQKSFRNGVSSSKLQKRYGRIVNFDKNIYQLLAKAVLSGRENPNRSLDCNELLWHLLGKYVGSVLHHVINL